MSLESVVSPRASLELPDLETYTDFRLYLSDWFEHRRREFSQSVRPYTYAHFSAAADIKSPNYLKLIIEGQRNLSDEMMRKFAKALQLNREQAEEFIALVRYGQASDSIERTQQLKKLSEIRVKRKMARGEINALAYEKVPSWVSLVLFHLVDQEGAVFEPKVLREILKNKTSLETIQKALEKLFASGELKLNENGEVIRGRELIDSAGEIPVALVRKLQAEMTYLGLESLEEDDPQERDFGGFTLALSHQEFEQLKYELRKLRKKLFTEFSVNRTRQKGEKVYQLNIQLFPLTKATRASKVTGTSKALPQKDLEP